MMSGFSKEVSAVGCFILFYSVMFCSVLVCCMISFFFYFLLNFFIS